MLFPATASSLPLAAFSWTWIFDNWQVLLVVVGGLATWLNQRKREREGLPADYDEDGVPENQPRRADPAAPVSGPFTGGEIDDEETRRAREEIRRKIAERRAAAGGSGPGTEGGGAPASPFRPASPAPPPVIVRERRPPEATQPPLPDFELPPIIRELLGDQRPRETSPAPAPTFAPPPLVARERARSFDEAPEYLEEGPAPTLPRPRAATAYRDALGAPVHARSSAAALALQAELRDPVRLRRAFLLREVLDRPVALR